jgi:HEAT repeat protein
MKKAKDNGKDSTAWMDMLASKDGMLRQKAREALVKLGKPAVPSLIQALKPSQPDQVRWEAAKALSAIGDVRSIPALVDTLEDRESGVAWLAAEALHHFNQVAWVPLLQALVERGTNSVPLRQGAHHVLRNQEGDGFNDVLAALLKALESSTVPEATAVAALAFLKRVETEI